MALGKKKKSPPKEDGGVYRQIGAIWENQSDKKDTFFSISFKNLDPGANKPEDFVKGRLIWQDVETDQYFLVKGCNVLANTKSDKPAYNLSINLENEYHVEVFSED